jgi:hypothetical protein
VLVAHYGMSGEALIALAVDEIMSKVRYSDQSISRSDNLRRLGDQGREEKKHIGRVDDETRSSWPMPYGPQEESLMPDNCALPSD